MSADPDGEAPGPIEKLTAWVPETLTVDDDDKGDDKDKPEAPSSTSEAKPAKTSAPSPAAGVSATGHAGHAGRAVPGAAPAIAPDMAHGMAHDMGVMVRDMRNRFWICLVSTLPIFVYARWAACGGRRRHRSGWVEPLAVQLC